MIQLKTLIAGLALLAAAHAAASNATVYSARKDFNRASGARVVDNYENPNYQHVMSDAAMSAVFGEAQYLTYGGNVVDYNNIMPGFGVGGSNGYCSLCYGSFRLIFENTSLAIDGGVHGVAIDVTLNSAATLPYHYSAAVTFVGGAVEKFDLPYVAEQYPAHPDARFWGITSDVGIRHVDFVSYLSSGPDRTFLIIDNLTISAAPVPEPSAVILLMAGLCAIRLGCCRGDSAKSA